MKKIVFLTACVGVLGLVMPDVISPVYAEEQQVESRNSDDDDTIIVGGVVFNCNTRNGGTQVKNNQVLQIRGVGTFDDETTAIHQAYKCVHSRINDKFQKLGYPQFCEKSLKYTTIPHSEVCIMCGGSEICNGNKACIGGCLKIKCKDGYKDNGKTCVKDTSLEIAKACKK